VMAMKISPSVIAASDTRLAVHQATTGPVNQWAEDRPLERLLPGPTGTVRRRRPGCRPW
jgi:hypothetical protein